MKQLLWFVYILTLSGSIAARASHETDQAGYHSGDQLFLLNEPCISFSSYREIPIYNEQTGELVEFVPPSIARIAHIIINTPREYRDEALRACGITVRTIQEND
jgi:hypothetical protein